MNDNGEEREHVAQSEDHDGELSAEETDEHLEEEEREASEQSEQESGLGENRLTSEPEQEADGAQWSTSDFNSQKQELNKLLAQTQSPSSGQGPLSGLKGFVDQLGRAVQSEHLKMDENTQKSLKRSSSQMAKSERTEKIMEQVRALQDFIETEGLQGIKSNQKQCNKIVNKLERKISQERIDACQAAQESMQQAVSALAQAQAGMIAGEKYSQISQLLSQCKQRIQHVQNPYKPFS